MNEHILIIVLCNLGVRKEERMGISIFITKTLCLFCIFGVQNAQLCGFLCLELSQDELNHGRDTPSSSSLGTFFILRHTTYLLCYANEATASGLKCAILCESLKEKDPINTKNLDQRTFYYKTRSFLKDSKHDEFLFATEFMKIDDSLCGCFNWVFLAV